MTQLFSYLSYYWNKTRTFLTEHSLPLCQPNGLQSKGIWEIYWACESESLPFIFLSFFILLFFYYLVVVSCGSSRWFRFFFIINVHVCCEELKPLIYIQKGWHHRCRCRCCRRFLHLARAVILCLCCSVLCVYVCECVFVMILQQIHANIQYLFILTRYISVVLVYVLAVAVVAAVLFDQPFALYQMFQ